MKHLHAHFRLYISYNISSFIRRDCDRAAQYLSKSGIKAKAYHAGLTNKQRSHVQKSWLKNKFKVKLILRNKRKTVKVKFNRTERVIEFSVEGQAISIVSMEGFTCAPSFNDMLFRRVFWTNKHLLLSFFQK